MLKKKPMCCAGRARRQYISSTSLLLYHQAIESHRYPNKTPQMKNKNRCEIVCSEGGCTRINIFAEKGFYDVLFTCENTNNCFNENSFTITCTKYYNSTCNINILGNNDDNTNDFICSSGSTDTTCEKLKPSHASLSPVRISTKKQPKNTQFRGGRRRIK